MSLNISRSKKIVLLRHAQSEANIGQHIKNAPLSRKGIEQAQQLHENFDLILISPLRRALQTLDYSSLKTTVTEICDLCREQYFHESDMLDHETYTQDEPSYSLEERVRKFHNLLEEKSKIYNNILVISHANFLARLTQGEQFDNAKPIIYWEHPENPYEQKKAYDAYYNLWNKK